jgi:hypothetical protein
MKLAVVKGTTSKLVQVFVQDSSVTTGAGLTGLVYNSGSLTAYYYREGAASATSITLATMTLGTWASGGFKVVDGTNMPGVYQLGIPDAALASGANSVVIVLKGATNMVPVVMEVELTAVDTQTTFGAAVWDYVLEGSYTAKQLFRLCTAALVGKVAGAATTNVTIRDTADSKNRIDATVDAYGNRTAVTLDAS